MGNHVFLDRSSPRGKRQHHHQQEHQQQQQHLTESLIVSKEMNVRDVYDVVEVIGEGSISTIYKIRKTEASSSPKTNTPMNSHPTIPSTTSSSASSTSSSSTSSSSTSSSAAVIDSKRNVYYALKEMNLAKMEPDLISELTNEIDVLRQLDHPNIIRAYESYHYKLDDNDSSNKMIGIVLELCEGGNLYSRAPYTEQQAGAIIYKLVEAVNYMHQHHFIHRDIKMENIMFESNDPNAEIKLADFGLSVHFTKNQTFNEFVGTVYTSSPEVLMGHYTQATDMWSVGVVAFVLLCGEKPFWADTLENIKKKITRSLYCFESPAWKSVSDDAKRFVAKLLEFDPCVRYTAKKALNDKWLAPFKPSIQLATVRDLLFQLMHHNISPQRSEFERLAWLVIARKATPDMIANMRGVFEELDQDHDGLISLHEFKTAMIKIVGCRRHCKRVDGVFRQVDVQNAGAVDYTSFLAALLAAQGHLQPEGVGQVFDHLDVNNCGYITHDHLRQVFGGDVGNNDYIDRLMQEVDTNKNGRICCQELKYALRKKDELLDHPSVLLASH